MYEPEFSLYDHDGERKYLNQKERLSFLECTNTRPLYKRLFCQLLYYTGARIAEIHNLTTQNIDFSNQTVVIRTLKQRKKKIRYREIPVPDLLLEILKSYIDDMGYKQGELLRLWEYSLRSASRYVKEVMVDAGITGVRACSRGLRHGFAVHSLNSAPITLVKKWMGHSSLETTAIYLNVIGEEERIIAQKMWARDLMELENVTRLQTSA